MARYVIYLRHSARGWEWSRQPEAVAWWGYYKTEGLARSAAKRSTTGTVGGHTNPRDYEFVLIAESPQ